jgi:hypothetical protein
LKLSRPNVIYFPVKGYDFYTRFSFLSVFLSVYLLSDSEAKDAHHFLPNPPYQMGRASGHAPGLISIWVIAFCPLKVSPPVSSAGI